MKEQSTEKSKSNRMEFSDKTLIIAVSYMVTIAWTTIESSVNNYVFTNSNTH